MSGESRAERRARMIRELTEAEDALATAEGDVEGARAILAETELHAAVCRQRLDAARGALQEEIGVPAPAGRPQVPTTAPTSQPQVPAAAKESANMVTVPANPAHPYAVVRIDSRGREEVLASSTESVDCSVHCRKLEADSDGDYDFAVRGPGGDLLEVG